jgi:hypothetical protein
MKTWLTKFKISNALDAGKPLPERLRRKIAADAELERFVDCAESLGRSLRNAAIAAPPLHEGIMRGVRSVVRQEEAQRAPVLSWLAASAGIAAMGTIYFWLSHPQSAGMDMASPFGGLALLLRRAVEGAVLP